MDYEQLAARNLSLMRTANGMLSRSFTAVNGMVFGAKNRELLATLQHMKKLVQALDATTIALRDATKKEES